MTSREKVTPHARLTYMNFCLLLDLRLVIIYYYVALPMSFQQIFFIVFFLLQFIDIVFFFLKLKVCGNLTLGKSISTIFQTALFLIKI